MKTPLQKLFILFACLSGSMAFAQPTLTDANCNPVAGETFSVVISNSISPGSAGANQSWNLGAMTATGSGLANTYVAATTASGSIYPNSNVNYQDALMSLYLKTSTTVLQNYGKFHHAGSNPGKIVTTYSDPIDMLHYPVNFNDTYTDSYVGTRYSTSNTTPSYIRFGTYTVTADGYGTLTIPSGVYTNVMRVHMHSINRDSIANNSSGSYYMQDEYLWYLPGTHYPIAGYINYDGVMHSFYMSSNLTGLKENHSNLFALDLYPSPASDIINIHFPVSANEKMQLGIYNSLGQELKTIALETTATDDVKISTSDLSNGIYILQVTDKGNILSSKRFIINK
ncbi:MAG: T9SS type A sorting domain-containing protein [Bacteroidia bacterium]